MRAGKYIWVVVVFIVVLGCGARRPVIEVGGYFFEFEGKTYRIESITPNFLEGYNMLILREGEQLVIKGLDKEQDGVLDELSIGDISLEKAKEIYQEGIREGRRRGYIRVRSIAREFRTVIDSNRYILVTYILALGEIYNKLTINHFFGEDTVVLDLEADGIIDKVEMGDKSLGHYQKIYRMVLGRGLMDGDVVKTDGMYIVELR